MSELADICRDQESEAVDMDMKKGIDANKGKRQGRKWKAGRGGEKAWPPSQYNYKYT